MCTYCLANYVLGTGGSSLDIGYWESLLTQLKAALARARLRDRHQELLKNKLYKLKLEQLGEQAVEGQPLFPAVSRVCVAKWLWNNLCCFPPLILAAISNSSYVCC